MPLRSTRKRPPKRPAPASEDNIRLGSISAHYNDTFSASVDHLGTYPYSGGFTTPIGSSVSLPEDCNVIDVPNGNGSLYHRSIKSENQFSLPPETLNPSHLIGFPNYHEAMSGPDNRAGVNGGEQYNFAGAGLYGGGGYSGLEGSAPFIGSTYHQIDPTYPAPRQGHHPGQPLMDYERPLVGEGSSSSLHRADSGAKAALSDGNGDNDDAQGKRRRVQRACDVCRRKKVRCDGVQPGKNACTNCLANGLDCKFEEAAKRRAPPRSYVEALEARSERMEQLISQLAPGIDFTDRLGYPVRLPEDSKDLSPKGETKTLAQAESSEPAMPLLPIDPVEREALVAKLGGKMKIESDDETDGGAGYDAEEVAFVTHEHRSGSPSELDLRMRRESDESEGDEPDESISESTNNDSAAFFGNSSAFHTWHTLSKIGSTTNPPGPADKGRTFNSSEVRPVFWMIPRCLTLLEWTDNEAEVERVRSAAKAVWPEPDLESKLLDCYFDLPHREHPILNEVIFRRQLQDPEKRKHRDVLMLAMTVFSIAARHCDDDRLIEREYPEQEWPHTKGSKWFNTCRRLGFSFMGPNLSLEHMQALVLTARFTEGTYLFQQYGWVVIGSIVRMLLGAGAHRNLTAARLTWPPPLLDSWRRLWWNAYTMDLDLATLLGRPLAVQAEDFDVDFPYELDDDVLVQGGGEHGETPKQPDGQPARISGFLCGLKLDAIIGKTLRTIYAITKTKTARGLQGKQWDQLIVAEIDSLLNKWLDSVPAHLRYNPDEPSDEWLIQSTMLYCKYYYCQILVHRPFISGPKTRSLLNFPSLAITTNAARSTVQILYHLYKRGLLLSGSIRACSRAFEAACILLIVAYNSKKNGLRVSTSIGADVRKCGEMMSHMEKRWTLAGKFSDLLKVISTSMASAESADDAESCASIKAKRKSLARLSAEVDPNDASDELSFSSAGKADSETTASSVRKPSSSKSRQGSNVTKRSPPPRPPLPLTTVDLAESSPHSVRSSTNYPTPDGRGSSKESTKDSLLQKTIGKSKPLSVQTSSSQPPRGVANDEITPVARPSGSHLGSENPGDMAQARAFHDNAGQSEHANGHATLNGSAADDNRFYPALAGALDLPNFASALFGAPGSSLSSTDGYGDLSLPPGFENLFDGPNYSAHGPRHDHHPVQADMPPMMSGMAPQGQPPGHGQGQGQAQSHNQGGANAYLGGGGDFNGQPGHPSGFQQGYDGPPMQHQQPQGGQYFHTGPHQPFRGPSHGGAGPQDPQQQHMMPPQAQGQANQLDPFNHPYQNVWNPDWSTAMPNLNNMHY